MPYLAMASASVIPHVAIRGCEKTTVGTISYEASHFQFHQTRDPKVADSSSCHGL
jgi:hypothetical protein